MLANPIVSRLMNRMEDRLCVAQLGQNGRTQLAESLRKEMGAAGVDYAALSKTAKGISAVRENRGEAVAQQIARHDRPQKFTALGRFMNHLSLDHLGWLHEFANYSSRNSEIAGAVDRAVQTTFDHHLATPRGLAKLLSQANSNGTCTVLLLAGQLQRLQTAGDTKGLATLVRGITTHSVLDAADMADMAGVLANMKLAAPSRAIYAEAARRIPSAGDAEDVLTTYGYFAYNAHNPLLADARTVLAARFPQEPAFQPRQAA